MTEFRALPIRRGDAYLLRSGRGDYLFDGGAEGHDVPALLSERKVRKLRAAICTAPSRERLGGILELLESDFNVGEYWLPEGMESLLEMARRFDGDWENWLHNTGGGPDRSDGEGSKGWTELAELLPADEGLRRLEGAAVLLGLGMSACLGWSPYAGLARDIFCGRRDGDRLAGMTRFFNATLELLTDRAADRWRDQKETVSRILRRAGWRIFHGGGPADLAMLCGRLLLDEADLLPGGEERGLRSLVTTLAMVAMTGALMSRSDARFLFLRSTGKLEDRLIPHHPVKCANGVVSSPLSRLPASAGAKAILQQVRQLSGHKDGLVFQYGDKDCGVLVCSDTKMSFLATGQSLLLDRPTVVTAPRQGSPSNERAYAHIASAAPDRDIWVRSHYSTARKTAHAFKELPEKMCLNNCVHLTLQEILLLFRDDKWQPIAGGRCICSG